ncbi:MAG: Rap1a/Tai family immunity protein [Acidiferrobacterales bacterium]
MWIASVSAAVEVTGNTLLEECTTKRLSQTACTRFLEGTIEGYRLGAATRTTICFPEKASLGKAKKVVVRYLRKNASKLDGSAAELVVRALSEAWPCTR